MKFELGTLSLDEIYCKIPSEGLSGAISINDAAFLADLIRVYKPKSCLEVGVAAGVSSILIQNERLRQNVSLNKLVSIDILHHFYSDPSKKVGFLVEQMVSDANKHFEIHGGKTTRNLKSVLQDSTVDFVFIDGDHQHPNPSIDIINILEHVSEKTIILLHDVNLIQYGKEFQNQQGPRFAYDAIPNKVEHVYDNGQHGNIGGFVLYKNDIKEVRSNLLRCIDHFPWETTTNFQ